MVEQNDILNGISPAEFLANAIEDSSLIGIQYVQGRYRVYLRFRRRGDQELIAIRESFGGALRFQMRPEGMVWWLNYTGTRVEAVLRSAYPFLTTKKEHADLVFLMQASIDDNSGRRGIKLPKEISDYRNDLVRLMKEVNDRTRDKDFSA